ncbi:MAG: putative maturation protein [Gulmivirus nemorisvicinum]|uniref:Maturation protein n=1 Tax=Leviviridae sp. TaxID=2027243 RepID=A0ABY3SUS5_9VIRU|nr:MAG: putative maturation protein [Leviviridae sp.]
MSRSRTLSYVALKGGHAEPRIPGLSPTTQSDIVRKKWTQDVVGNYPNPNPFLSYSDYGVVPVTSYSGSTNSWAMTNWIRSVSWTPPPVAAIPSDDELVTRALAVSNPNRPVMDIGQIGQDIWDAPSLFKDVFGRLAKVARNPSSFYKRAGKDYLAYQFGIAPTVQDFKTMLNFMDAVEKRKSVIRDLRSQRGLRRMTKSGTYLGTPGPTVQFYAHTIYGSAPLVAMQWRYQVNVWMSTRYALSALSPFLDRPIDATSAARWVLGLDPSNAATIWALTPWSWLADWFGNTRDVFNSTLNTLGATASECCVMKHTGGLVDNLHVVSMNGCTGTISPIPAPVYVKRRTPFVDPQPSLSFHLPFLDGGQLSILAALAHSRTWRLFS